MNIRKEIQFLLAGLLLLTLCFFFHSKQFKSTLIHYDVDKIESKIEQQHQQFASIFQNFSTEDSLTVQHFVQFNEKEFTISYFQNERIKYWSKRSNLPESLLGNSYSDSLIVAPYGKALYLIANYSMPNNSELIFSYPIVNQNGEVSILKRPISDFQFSNEGEYEVNLPGNTSQSIFIEQPESFRTPMLLIICWYLAIILGVYGTFTLFLNEPRPFPTPLNTILFVVVLFSISKFVTIDIFGIFDKLEIFKSSLYANKYIADSLGNFFVFMITIALFIHYWYSKPMILDEQEENIPKPLIYLLISALLIAGTYAFLYTIRSLILDSSQEIYFFLTFNFNTLFIILVFNLIGWTYFFFIFRIIRFVAKRYNENKMWTILFYVKVLIVCFLLFYISFGLKNAVIFVAWSQFLVLPLFYFQIEGKMITTFTQVVFFIFCFATICAYILQTYTQEKDYYRLKQIARQVSIENDYLASFLLNRTNELISEDQVIQDQLSVPFLSRKTIAQRIDNLYLSDDFDDYVYQIEILNPEEVLEEFRTIESPVVNLISGDYFRIEFEDYIPIFNRQNELINIIKIDLYKPKLTDDEQYEPMLDNSQKEFSFLNYRKLSYAVIQDNVVVDFKGNIDGQDEEVLNHLELGEFRQLNTVDTDSYAYQFKENSFVLFSLPKPEIANRVVVNLAYIFTIIVYVYVFFILVFSRGNLSNLQFFRKSLANRVKFFIIASTYISAFIISFITFNLIYTEIDKSQLEIQNTKLQTIGQEFYNEHQSIEDYSVFQNFINYLADKHYFSASDYHFFDAAGNLAFSNDPTLFNKEIWPTRVSPMALATLQSPIHILYNQEEKVLSKKYDGFYYGLKDKENQLAGILYHPAFGNAIETSLQQNTFANLLFSAFTIVLTLLTFVILAFSKSFTDILENIRKRISNVEIGQNYKPLQWDFDDEIGLLVNEYNQMVKKLDDNAVVMARTERESAWRDIAKQIAHEIKNPLTPMLLSIQHLRRRVDSYDGELKDSFSSTLSTLESQIHHLAKIANDFSSVAKMTLPEFHKIDLKEVLSELNNMFETGQHYTYHSYDQTATKKTYINADKTMINRVFTNLLKNSVQAIRGKADGEVKLFLSESEEDYIIQIVDNGTGIAPENRAKIFTPNFTTKKAGTGIGLMMSKKIIETHKGEIFFESQLDSGTTFTVKLPKYNLQNGTE